MTEEIVLAQVTDLDRILDIYDIAKKYMHENGNPNQWNGAYPDRNTLLRDMEKKQLYTYKQDGVIHAVFVLMLEEEPTYVYIEGDGWFSEAPYGTIHRIAGDGEIKGIFRKCMGFCERRISHVRIDTHEDNKIMQHVVEKYGFRRCGIIYLKDGNPRIAYEYEVSC